MDAPLSALGAPLRIRRRTAWERQHLPRAASNISELSRNWTRSELEARLPRPTSPYYREVFRAHGLAPGDLQTFDDLRHFPLLDRATFAARWSDLPTLDNDDNVVVLSSGSTGAPVRVVRDGYDSLYMWAVLGFFARRLGVELPRKPRVVLLDSLPSGLEYSVRLRLLDDGALHRISLFRERPLERLRRAGPAVICSDPAGLHWLAAQSGAPAARLILSSAQHLSPAARVFSAPIVNYLSTTETGPIAWECLAALGTFHVLAPDMWVEEVAGELVVTRLRASVLPILRYQLGDRGHVAWGACACGFQGQSITDFNGRSACLFAAPSGEKIDAWRLAWVFKPYPLARFRLGQIGASDFELDLVADMVPPALLDELAEALRRLGWFGPRITARAVASLEAPGGKPEPFYLKSRA